MNKETIRTIRNIRKNLNEEELIMMMNDFKYELK